MTGLRLNDLFNTAQNGGGVDIQICAIFQIGMWHRVDPWWGGDGPIRFLGFGPIRWFDLFQFDQQIFGIDLRTGADIDGLDHRVAFGVQAGFHFHRLNRQQQITGMHLLGPR
jgi:hypothetical protein